MTSEVLRKHSGTTFSTSTRQISPFFGMNSDLDATKKDMMADLIVSPLSSSLDSMSASAENSVNPRSWLTEEALATEFNTVPICQRVCVKSLYNAVAKMMKTYDYIEKHRDICRAYKEATFCVAEEHRRCGESDEMFNVISSGMKYVCVEQRNAFNSFIACINREAHSIQTVCEDECSYHNHLFNILTRLSLANDFGDLLGQLRSSVARRAHTVGVTSMPYKQDLDVGQDSMRDKTPSLMIDQEIPQIDTNSLRTFEDVVDQACVYGECALGCLRNKFNMKCEENVGSLISEALIRPLVEGHQKFSPLFIAFGVIAPKSCSFLYKGSSLLRHRIDPEVNDALLTKYGRAESVDINEDKDYTDDTNEMADQMKFRSIDAESDLEHFINIIYGNGTLEEAKILNATFLEEDNILQPSSGQSESTSSALENDTLFDIVLNEGSGHLDEIVVFRATLPTDMLSFEFTPNISGAFVYTL